MATLTTKNKYKKISQLGEKGKEAKTYLVVDKFNCEYAMKTFRRNKSSEKMTEEVELQRRCSKAGISPRIIDYDTEDKFIVMEKMDGHLIDLMKTTQGILSDDLQKQIISLFKKMDKIKVFQGDANILNYMIKGNNVFIIDFGYSKEVDEKLIKKLGTKTPNIELMLLGFILKLKDLKCPGSSFSLLKKYLSEEKRKSYNI